MKRILVLLVFFIAVAYSTALQAQPAGIPYPTFAPYPPVLSPALRLLPQGFVTIIVGDETYYYYQGIFYQKIIIDDQYAVVPPPVGAVVFSIPPGYQYMLVDGEEYYVYGGVYYIRVLEGFKVVFPPAIV